MELYRSPVAWLPDLALDERPQADPHVELYRLHERLFKLWIRADSAPLGKTIANNAFERPWGGRDYLRGGAAPSARDET